MRTPARGGVLRRARRSVISTRTTTTAADLGLARRVVRKRTEGITAPGTPGYASSPYCQQRGNAVARQVRRAAYTATHPVAVTENRVIGAALNSGRPKRRRRRSLLSASFGKRRSN